MSTGAAVRYSTTNVDKSQSARSFSWENPVPVNKFWDSINYCNSRSFLGAFTDTELARLPIDPASDADNAEKYALLLKLLQEKLAKEEAAAAPKGLHELDYKRWNTLVQGVYVFQEELGLPEAEQSLRLLVDKAEKDNVVPRHMLGGHLVKHGKYVEAEETERPVLDWMLAHPRLGEDSPQALGARRIIARALWGQGLARRTEAEALLAQLKSIADGMGNGHFAVYKDEERRQLEDVVAELT